MLFMPDTPSRQLKVAMIGCGGHAFRSILPSLDYLPVELVATCNRARSKAEIFARRFGAKAALGSLQEVIDRGDIEAVLLSVGPKQHPDLACQALEAGLHVWMEKPPSADVAGIDRMIAAARKAGRQVAVGFKKIFMPGLERAKAFASDAKFGPMRSIIVRFPLDVPGDGPAVLAEQRFTNWLGNGVHPLSVLVELGGRPEWLQVHRSPHGGGFLALGFVGGAIGCLHLAEGSSPAGPLERYEIVCQHGHIVLDNCVDLTAYRPQAGADYRTGWNFAAGDENSAAVTYRPQNSLSMLTNKALFLQGFVQELDHFVTACLDGSPVTRGNLEFARAVMECYEAALLSQGQAIRLDNLPCNRAQGPSK
jgi:predicted dehydrogenase